MAIRLWSWELPVDPCPGWWTAQWHPLLPTESPRSPFASARASVPALSGTMPTRLAILPLLPSLDGWLAGCFQYLLIEMTNSRPHLFFTSPTRRFFNFTYTHGGMTESGNSDVVFQRFRNLLTYETRQGLLVRWGTEIDEDWEEKRRGDAKQGRGAAMAIAGHGHVQWPPKP